MRSDVELGQSIVDALDELLYYSVLAGGDPGRLPAAAQSDTGQLAQFLEHRPGGGDPARWRLAVT